MATLQGTNLSPSFGSAPSLPAPPALSSLIPLPRFDFLHLNRLPPPPPLPLLTGRVSLSLPHPPPLRIPDLSQLPTPSIPVLFTTRNSRFSSSVSAFSSSASSSSAAASSAPCAQSQSAGISPLPPILSSSSSASSSSAVISSKDSEDNTSNSSGESEECDISPLPPPAVEYSPKSPSPHKSQVSPSRLHHHHSHRSFTTARERAGLAFPSLVPASSEIPFVASPPAALVFSSSSSLASFPHFPSSSSSSSSASLAPASEAQAISTPAASMPRLAPIPAARISKSAHPTNEGFFPSLLGPSPNSRVRDEKSKSLASLENEIQTFIKSLSKVSDPLTKFKMQKMLFQRRLKYAKELSELQRIAIYIAAIGDVNECLTFLENPGSAQIKNIPLEKADLLFQRGQVQLLLGQIYLSNSISSLQQAENLYQSLILSNRGRSSPYNLRLTNCQKTLQEAKKALEEYNKASKPSFDSDSES